MSKKGIGSFKANIDLGHPYDKDGKSDGSHLNHVQSKQGGAGITEGKVTYHPSKGTSGESRSPKVSHHK